MTDNNDEILTRVEDIIEPMSFNDEDDTTLPEEASYEPELPKKETAAKRKKKNTILIVSACVCAVLLAFLLISSLSKPKYKVSFVSDEGKEIISVDVKQGQKVQLIEAPKKDDYIFVCWMLGTKEFDEDEVITEDIVLKAKYAKRIIVTYLDINGKKITTQDIAYGEKIIEPLQAPDVKDKQFVCWKMNDKEFDFKKPIKENTELRAFYETFIKAQRILFDKNEFTVSVGQEIIAKVDLLPVNTTEKVQYKISDTTVASVDDKGKVKGLKPGTVTITAVIGDCSPATAVVSVKEILPESISFKYSNSVNIPLYGGYMTEVEVLPEDAVNKKVTYTSSDPEIAYVDEDGSVWAKNVGECVIIATTENGKTATLKVRVAVGISTTTITPPGVTLKYGENNSVTLTLTIYPEIAVPTDIQWQILSPPEDFTDYYYRADGKEFTLTLTGSPEKKFAFMISCYVEVEPFSASQVYTLNVEPSE